MGSVSTPDTQNSNIRSKQQQQHSYQQQQPQQLLQPQHQLQVPDIFYTQGGTIGGYVTTKQQQKEFSRKPVEIKHLFLKPILNYNNKFRRLHICSSSSNNIRHQHPQNSSNNSNIISIKQLNLMVVQALCCILKLRSIFITSGR